MQMYSAQNSHKYIQNISTMWQL